MTQVARGGWLKSRTERDVCAFVLECIEPIERGPYVRETLMRWMLMSDDKTIIAVLPPNNSFSAPKRNPACLMQYSGAKMGNLYPLVDAESIVGRNTDVQIVIVEQSVSRRHARIIQMGKRVDVEDLQSANGTFVNDVKVEGKVTLKHGDMLRLGTILMKFFAEDNIESMINDKIFQRATIDEGTQIFNKKYLLDTLDTNFKISKTSGRALSVIYYDLDFFKKVNDTYGHNAGDYVLKECSTVVKSMVRKQDVLARFGGEEFVIVLPDTDARVAAELAERIRDRVSKHPFVIDYESPEGKKRVTHKQTISVGVSQLAADQTTPTALLDSADRKLYVSKQSGRNRVTT